MTARAIAQLLQSAPATALPGTWKLARGRAITLRPASDVTTSLLTCRSPPMGRTLMVASNADGGKSKARSAIAA